MEWRDLLEWANLALIPALFYVVKLERRLMSLELSLRLIGGQCTRDRSCKMPALAEAKN